jgi:molecular chaperone DnaJ
MADDYYKTLGVDRSATVEDIKRAYRKLAHQHHPDKAGGNEEAFKKVNEAYQVLGDEQKRQQYDQFGQTFESGGAPGGNPFGGFQGDFGGFEDIFSQFFGGQQRATGPTEPRRSRGENVQIDVTIDFIQAATETAKEVTHQLYQTCTHCHGNGAEPGTPIETCPTCKGSGQVTQTQQTMFGVFSQASVCPTCRGEGKTAKTPCRECHGQGRTKQTRKLKITIPAGIDDGQTLRLSGKGQAATRGGINGDLYAVIHVRPHAELKRRGDDVLATAKISFIDAALGTSMTVPTLKGKEFVSIKAGVQPGETIKLAQQGFPHLETAGRGDQIITIHVEVPKKLSSKQRELLEQFKTAKKKGLFF